MIYDAIVEVSCDNCNDSIEVAPAYVYDDYSGKSGHYDTRNNSIEHQIEQEHGWIVEDGKHYCCEECKNNH